MAVMSSVPARAMVLAAGRDDSAELLARLGLDPTPGPPSLIDAESFYEVVETIVGDGDPGLPYRYAQSFSIDQYGVLGLAFKTATTLRAALQRAERYVALMGDAVHYELRSEGDGDAVFVVGGRPAHRLGVCVANEGAIAALVSVCREVTAPDSVLTPTSVSFAHRSTGPLDAAEEFFGCPVRHGQAVDAFRLDQASLDSTTRLGDDALSEYLLDQLEEELRSAEAERGLHARVRHVIANGLADGVPPMRVVASRVGMSERTLQRRLADDDLRFQDLLVEVRRTVATALLTTTDHSLVDIAFLTGFSEQSAFQRAFKRWTGRTPLEVRRA
ncbi:MAG: AraC family transcriptional regulator [Actinomycetota bacterium]